MHKKKKESDIGLAPIKKIVCIINQPDMADKWPVRNHRATHRWEEHSGQHGELSGAGKSVGVEGKGGGGRE